MNAFHTIAQVFRQDPRVVALLIMRRIEKRHRALHDQRFQSCDLVLIAFELPPIMACKLGVALRIVAEPLAQTRARRDFLQPASQFGVRFAQPTRPQPVHKNAGPVGGVRRVVSAFDPDPRALLFHLLKLWLLARHLRWRSFATLRRSLYNPPRLFLQ